MANRSTEIDVKLTLFQLYRINLCLKLLFLWKMHFVLMEILLSEQTALSCVIVC